MSEHELWNELGNLYFMSGAYDQAIHAYHRSIQLDEAYGRPYSNLALIYAQQGKVELSTGLFRKSLDLLSDNHEKAITWNRLGNLYRQQRDYTEAVVAFQHADALDPDCRDGRDDMGQMLYATSDLSILERAQEMKQAESHAPPAESAAGAEASAGQHEAGRPEARSAAEVAEDFEEELAESEWQTDWTDLESESASPEPTVELPAPLEIDDASADADVPELVVPERYPLSFSLPAMPGGGTRQTEASFHATEVDVDVLERPAEAAATAEGAEADSHPESAAAVAPAAEAPAAEGQLIGEAEVEYAKLERMVQVNPNNAAAWDSLGNLHKSLGKYEEALMAYQQAVALEPQRADFHHHLGLVHAILGRNEDAIMSFQKVLELAPDHSLAHATLGGYYRKMGLDELAQKHLGKAMRNIYDSESEYNRACFEAIRGNVDQALELLRIALASKQTYAEWVLHDPDLDFIRDDPRFRKLVAEYRR